MLGTALIPKATKTSGQLREFFSPHIPTEFWEEFWEFGISPRICNICFPPCRGLRLRCFPWKKHQGKPSQKKGNFYFFFPIFPALKPGLSQVSVGFSSWEFQTCCGKGPSGQEMLENGDFLFFSPLFLLLTLIYPRFWCDFPAGNSKRWEGIPMGRQTLENGNFFWIFWGFLGSVFFSRNSPGSRSQSQLQGFPEG